MEGGRCASKFGDSSRDDLPHSVGIQIFVRLLQYIAKYPDFMYHGSIRRLLCLIASDRGCARIPTYYFRITLGDRLFFQDQHCKTSHCISSCPKSLVGNNICSWLGILLFASAHRHPPWPACPLSVAAPSLIHSPFGNKKRR